MRNITIVFLLTFGYFCANAQQLPQYSLFSFQKAALHPAYAGLENTLNVVGTYRTQWSELSGAPQSQLLQVEMPLWLVGGGIGLQLQNDQLGSRQQTGVVASYSYHLPLAQKAILGIGGALGFQQQRIDGALIRTPQGNYENPIPQHGDPLLESGLMTANGWQASASAYLMFERLEIGLSAWQTEVLGLEFASMTYTPATHIYVSGQYRASVGRNLEVIPMAFAKYSGRQIQGEGQVQFWWNNQFFVGGGYRGFSKQTSDALVFVAGLRFKEQWLLGYAFDNTISPLDQVSFGSHEVSLRYTFAQPVGKGKLPPIIYNPRLLR